MVPVMQDAAAEALREGWPSSTAARLARHRASASTSTATGAASCDRGAARHRLPDWRKAVVLSKGGGRARIGFTDGSTGTLPPRRRHAGARRRRARVRLPEARA
jgi:penicillin-binding protein 1A